MQTLTSTPKLSLSGTSLVQITDATGNLAVVSTESLDINIVRISGSLPSSTAYLPIRLTDGTSYYDARQIRALTNTDIVKSQLQDNSANGITSQASGSQRALDVGIDVSGSQVDPRQIVDGTTATQKAKVDTAGRLWVYVGVPQNNVTIELIYSDAASLPINANEWQDVASYTVPTNYDLSIIQFFSISAQNTDDFRAVKRTALGSYNSATNTFTDGLSETSPAFSAELYVYVTTLVGNVADDTVTITYTNSLGVAGHTATTLIKKNTAVGSRQRVTLQAGDIGLIDVTNVTHTSTGQAGAWNIEGTTNLVRQNSGQANISEQSVFAVNSSVINQSETLIMQYKTTAAGAKSRTTILISSLVPRS